MEIGEEEFEGGGADEGGDEAGDDAGEFGFDQEGAFNEGGAGADEFHHVDFFAATENGDANGVVNHDDGNKEEDATEDDAGGFGDVCPVFDAFNDGAFGVIGGGAVGGEMFCEEGVVFDNVFDAGDVVDVFDFDGESGIHAFEEDFAHVFGVDGVEDFGVVLALLDEFFEFLFGVGGLDEADIGVGFEGGGELLEGGFGGFGFGVDGDVDFVAHGVGDGDEDEVGDEGGEEDDESDDDDEGGGDGEPDVAGEADGAVFGDASGGADGVGAAAFEEGFEVFFSGFFVGGLGVGVGFF